MLGLCCMLIFPQLCHMIVAERLVVLRIIDDGPALPAIVHHAIENIGARSTLRDAFNAVIRKFFFQSLEQVDLDFFAKLRSRHIRELALQIIDLALIASSLAFSKISR